MDFYKRFLVDLWGRRRDDFDWRVYQGPLDLASVGNVLILQLNGKLGDAMMISLLVDALANARPDLRIAVGTTPALVEYWQRNHRVAEVVALSCSRKRGRRMSRRIREAKRGARPLQSRFDLVVSFEPYAVADHFALLRTLRAKRVVGFNKHPYRLFDYSLEERRHGVVASPVAERTARVMEVFGRRVDCRTLAFSAPYDAEDERAARAVVDRLSAPGPRLLLNVYGDGPEKRLSPASTVRTACLLREAGHRGPIFVSVPSGAEAEYAGALREAGLDAGLAVIPPMADLFKLFALVAQMDAVVTPDTAVGHVAAAFGKPQVVMFAEGGTIPAAWKPYSDRCVGLLSQSGLSVNDVDWDELSAALGAMVACAREPSSRA